MDNVVLSTKHHKAQWISPYLSPLGYAIRESALFDTDTLGTFSNEVERVLSPKAAALFKAQKACQITGSDWGLGSEGSFGGGPAPGLINWDQEVLCLYQSSTGCTVYAYGAGPISVHGLSLQDPVPVKTRLAQFPGQHWILQTVQNIKKGLSKEDLLTALEHCSFADDNVKIEPDLRAMHCPERQQVIAKAAKDLARRLSANCPKCQGVNFVIKDKQSGLPCAMCSLPTEQAKRWIYQCDNCGFQCDEMVDEPGADPTHCQYCNP